ncbi:unnamed protein product [Closterium sp. NIES-53]
MAPGTFRAAASSAVHSGGSFGGIDSQAQQHADPGGSRNAQSSGVVVAEKYGLLAAVIAARGGCAVLDGGLATELELRGADLNDPLWSAKCLMEEEASSLVRKTARAASDGSPVPSDSHPYQPFAHLPPISPHSGRPQPLSPIGTRRFIWTTTARAPTSPSPRRTRRP